MMCVFCIIAIKQRNVNSALYKINIKMKFKHNANGDRSKTAKIMMNIGGGTYEARRLVPPQNLGPGGTLWRVPLQNFCLQMLLDPKLLY